jgi:hypothetical protein
VVGKVPSPVKYAVSLVPAIDTTQYTGIAAWKESDGTTDAPGNFAAGTIYTAVIRLTAKSGTIQLAGVPCRVPMSG